MSQRMRVLTMLQTADNRGVTSSEFYAAHLPRFGARLLELRERGYVIETQRESDSVWRYTLLNEPAVSSASAPTTGPSSETGPLSRHGAGADETASALFELPHRPAPAIDDDWGDAA
jgi:hypothetical protein